MRRASLALLFAAAGCGSVDTIMHRADWEPEIFIRAPIAAVRDGIADGMIRSGWHSGGSSRYGQEFERDDFRVWYSMTSRQEDVYVKARVSRTGPPAGPKGETTMTELKGEVQSFLYRLKRALEDAHDPAIGAPEGAAQTEPRSPPPAAPARDGELRNRTEKTLDRLGL